MRRIKFKPAIIGLGYVGLPLLVRISMNQKVIGFDLNSKRVDQLNNFEDKTNEINPSLLKKYKNNILITDEEKKLSESNLYIVTVPTPIKKNKKPDLSFILNATKLISNYIKKGDTIVYESTVYPGVTEDVCGPIISKKNNLKLNKDFFLGYSPERINPGDKKNTIDKIIKVVSGSNEKISKKIKEFYDSIIPAGTFLSKNIKTAEAAKVIENIQRDLNISLINELSIIFEKLNINIYDVLKASSTKWNFLKFEPGLVGGHCIGVDPYYLTYLSKSIGYNPKLILSGRFINESMTSKCVEKIIKKSLEKKINISLAKILFLGIAFKENCPDIRNSKNLELLMKLSKKFNDITVFDPLVNYDQINLKSKKIKLINSFPRDKYDIIVIAVAHDDLKKISKKNFSLILKKNKLIFDLKNKFSHLKPDMTL